MERPISIDKLNGPSLMTTGAGSMPNRANPPRGAQSDAEYTCIHEYKIAAIPSAELLREYDIVGHDLPSKVITAWQSGHDRSFRYAMAALIIGGLLALGLLGGFIYLVMQGHGGYAATLLGGGTLSMVAGFRSVRLNQR